MHNLFFEYYSISFLFKILFLTVLLIVFSFCWQSLYMKFNIFKNYNSVQRIHFGEIPRLGGFFVLLYIFISCYVPKYEFYNSFLSSLLISFIPIALFSLKDDLFQNSSVKLRFLSMILSILIFFNLYDFDFPILDIEFINLLISENTILISMFFLFSCLVVINGNNLIDGANGLMPLTNIFQLFVLLIMFQTEGDLFYSKSIICLIIPLLIFMPLNYPLGKIFMGDTGAYFYGFAISLLVIIFFGKYPNYLSLSAVCLLFYPCFELLFTFIRKIIIKVSPLKPDNRHLHSIIFISLSNRKNLTNLKKNNLVLPILSIFWIIPPLLALKFYDSENFLILGLATQAVIYMCMYYFFIKKLIKLN